MTIYGIPSTVRQNGASNIFTKSWPTLNSSFLSGIWLKPADLDRCLVRDPSRMKPFKSSSSFFFSLTLFLSIFLCYCWTRTSTHPHPRFSQCAPPGSFPFFFFFSKTNEFGSFLRITHRREDNLKRKKVIPFETHFKISRSPHF